MENKKIFGWFLYESHGDVEKFTIDSKKLEECQGAILIGRKKNMDWILNDKSISRTHAKIVARDEALAIKDMNSTNGVHINDKKCDNYRVLSHGDKINFGTLKFIYIESSGQAFSSDYDDKREIKAKGFRTVIPFAMKKNEPTDSFPAEMNSGIDFGSFDDGPEPLDSDQMTHHRINTELMGMAAELDEVMVRINKNLKLRGHEEAFPKHLSSSTAQGYFCEECRVELFVGLISFLYKNFYEMSSKRSKGRRHFRFPDPIDKFYSGSKHDPNIIGHISWLRNYYHHNQHQQKPRDTKLIGEAHLIYCEKRYPETVAEFEMMRKRMLNKLKEHLKETNFKISRLGS